MVKFSFKNYDNKKAVQNNKTAYKNGYRGAVVIIFIHHIDTPKKSIKQHRK